MFKHTAALQGGGLAKTKGGTWRPAPGTSPRKSWGSFLPGCDLAPILPRAQPRPWGLAPMGAVGFRVAGQGEQAGATHFPCSDGDTWVSQGTVPQRLTPIGAGAASQDGSTRPRCPCSPIPGIWTEVGGATLGSTEGWLGGHRFCQWTTRVTICCRHKLRT